jgi:hypothetical protein
VSAEAQERLRNLLRERDGFRHDLSQAELEGLGFVADAARREIQRLHGRIRKHCEFHGLARPRDVPERDE